MAEFVCTFELKVSEMWVIANLEVASTVKTFAVIKNLKLSHNGNERLSKRV